MTAHFSIARVPRIEFAPGAIDRLPEIIGQYGRRVLLVTGAKSFQGSRHWQRLAERLTTVGIDWVTVNVAGEPSPKLVDDTVRAHRGDSFAVVVAIGGGSVLDAGKAIAGLLVPGNSVVDHLEGVGPELPYRGPATPFIAVPTTAGTGSEATKNAVLSTPGANGFKKSFRDERLVAEYAVIDPDLLASCPPQIIAANGMDAFTQLLESYVSAKANRFTDALAVNGIEAVRDSLLPWFDQTGEISEHRANMAYAALLSGITLAQVGLGSVHGLAAPLGAFFPIPHGVACGTLVRAASQVNILSLRERDPHSPALRKYANVGRLLAGESLTDEQAQQALLDTLEHWTDRMELPRLGSFGVGESDVPRLVANSRGSSMKTNPVHLTDAEIAGLIRARL